MDDGHVDFASLNGSKRGNDYRLVVVVQQLLDCSPHQLNCLHCTSCGCQVTLPVQSRKHLGCQDTMRFTVSAAMHTYRRGQPSVPQSQLRAFAIAWLMSSKTLLHGNPDSDSRLPALTDTACSVPRRDLSCSLFKICIAQLRVC